MKTLYLSILAIVIVLATVTVNPVLGQISTGGPVQTVHYQLSQMVSSGKNVYVAYQQNEDNGGQFHVFFRKSSDGGKSFDNVTQLDKGSGIFPILSTSGNNVYVAWEDRPTGYPGSHVLFAKSVDGGNTFGDQIVLDAVTNSSSVITQLISDGNQLYAVIDELGENPPYQSDVYLRASQDNGSTWGQKVELLPAPIFTNPLALDITIAKTGNEIYAVGEDKSTCSPNPNICQFAIFFRKSDDMGKTFGNQINITKAQNPVELNMVASGSNIYVIWAGDGEGGQGVLFSKSNDGGNTFSVPVIISKPGDSEWPHIVADGKNVYIIWKFDNSLILSRERIPANLLAYQSGIFFTKSTDGGSTFSQPINISGDVGTSYFSGISLSNGNIFVSWTSKHGDNVQAFFSKSTDNGTTFDDPVDLTGGSNTWFSQITSSDDNVYIAGGTSLPGDVLWLKASNDDGVDFEPLVNLNNGTGTFTAISPSSICCASVVDQPWFTNGWLWTGVSISAVILCWFFLFRRFKEK